MPRHVNVKRIGAWVCASALGVTAALGLNGTTFGNEIEIAVARMTNGTLDVFVVTVSADQADAELARLREDGAHAGVNGRVFALTDPRVDEQWGYRRLGGPVLLANGAVGSDLVVAVLDTGVDARHAEFANRVLPGFDVLANEPVDVSTDPGGHGTHVAGIIAAASDGAGVAGLAPGIRILPVRVLDETGYGDDAGVAKGLVWAVDNGADIVNMSLGTYDDNPALRAAVEYAAAKGVVVVAAAGNDRAGGPTSYPAAYPQAVAVAATTAGEQRAFFSTTGSYVDLAAPGQMILSTYPDGQYVTMSGTSMAAPFVSAAVAVVAGHAGVSPTRAVDLLKETAIDLGANGPDSEFGVGLISVTEATGIAGEQPPVEDSFGMPGLPSLAPLPLPSIGTPSMPPLPDLSGRLPGRMPDLPTNRQPAPPALPGLTPLPTPSAPSGIVPSRPPVSSPPSLPAPTSPANRPAPLPDTDGTPVAPTLPVIQPTLPVIERPQARPRRVAVVLALATSGRTTTARIQAAGPGSSNAQVTVVTAQGRILARTRTDANGRAAVRVTVPTSTIVVARIGDSESNRVLART